MYYELNQISMAIFNNNRGKEEINWIEFCKCCLQINKTELSFKQQREKYPDGREDILKQIDQDGYCFIIKKPESNKILCFCGNEMKDAYESADLSAKIKNFQNLALNKDKDTDYDMS
eukprot:408440_1